MKSVVWAVVDGQDKGKSYQIDGDPITVGSASDNDLVLTDSTVSRHHAEVTAVGDGFLLKDLGSTNGTFLDGSRIREAFLAPGCRIRFGSCTLLFHPRPDKLLVLPDAEDHYGDVFGQSIAMRKLFALLKRVAASDITIILNGETGTGKDAFARAIHAQSARANGPLAVLDCSAVDRDLISSELFGHEPGAFTGAVKARPGAFEQAHRGTLFIDELGELPLDLQTKLIRAMEQREVRRLGGTRTIPVDCRVLAATHRDLPTMVKEGTFRQDLYFRFAQIVVRIPSLRERRDDIPFLVDRFLQEAGGTRRFSTEAMAALTGLPLPGNVRELKNLVERASALSTEPEIPLSALGPLDAEEAAPPQTSRETPRFSAELERHQIVDALKANDYHRARSAAQLGISVPTLRERIRRYGISIPGGRDPEG